MILAAHIIRLYHTGLYADGRPNLASVYVNDLDEGRDPQTGQHLKVTVYVPAGGFADIPFSTKSLLSLANGAIQGFIQEGILRAAFILRFRKIGDLGGSAGNGISLRVSGADPNVERTSGIAKFVINNDEDAVGFLVGERFSMTGLTGAFEDLNGGLVITSIEPETDLAGANPNAYTISVQSLGPDIASGQATTSTLALLDGKITVLLEGDGSVGGNADSDLYGYIGGQFYPIDLSSVGTALTIQDEGTPVETNTSIINFVGGGVTAASGGGGLVNVSIPGGGTSDGSGILSWGNSSVGSSTATRFMEPWYDNGLAPTNSNLTEMEIPRAGTLRNLFVRHGQPAGNGNNIVYTVLVNGAPTTLSVTLASTATSGSDTTNSVIVSQGDLVQLRVTKGAAIGAVPGTVLATAEFRA